MLRFETLKDISIDMTAAEKSAAIEERWNWLTNCVEKITKDKRVLLETCLRYAKDAFHNGMFQAASAEGYADFNRVFKKLVKQKHQDESTEAMLIRIEPLIKIMRHRPNATSANRLPNMLEQEMNHLLLGVISNSLKDNNSELAQCVRGARNLCYAGYALAIFIEVQGMLSRGDWQSGLYLAAFNTVLRYTWLSPYKDESANYAAKFMYKNYGYVRQALHTIDVESWSQRFFNHAKSTKDKVGKAASHVLTRSPSNNQ